MFIFDPENCLFLFYLYLDRTSRSKIEIRFWENQNPSFKINVQYQTNKDRKFKKLLQKFQE